MCLLASLFCPHPFSEDPVKDRPPPPPSVGTGHGAVVSPPAFCPCCPVPGCCPPPSAPPRRGCHLPLTGCSTHSEYLIDLLYSAQSFPPHIDLGLHCRQLRFVALQTPPPTGEMSHQVICLFGGVDFYHLCFDSSPPLAPGTSCSSQYFY